ncbi:uncharacterized protein NFIA_099290 [Aspergillus fischeri NRRL 181]|uniref:Uncharacterized protein n=1 Tax=Neosartorya fischeri (strain ATCC 1020 / DSM 3700 / CBS 544.65 / FGSC A1164 / JCM 1740 / NRRL 181 / WB 181) TaxID=331117 RepID=A1DBQ5_NEOFI|nr:uncharacterized protein NFIA_099290 [Aspergillus fischeri NRRL 181]EAW20295.1 hypothetical protein NFIA_099290 [Aspergillus fischeri NRRL 181]
MGFLFSEEEESREWDNEEVLLKAAAENDKTTGKLKVVYTLELNNIGKDSAIRTQWSLVNWKYLEETNFKEWTRDMDKESVRLWMREQTFLQRTEKGYEYIGEHPKDRVDFDDKEYLLHPTTIVSSPEDDNSADAVVAGKVAIKATRKYGLGCLPHITLRINVDQLHLVLAVPCDGARERDGDDSEQFDLYQENLVLAFARGGGQDP